MELKVTRAKTLEEKLDAIDEKVGKKIQGGYYSACLGKQWGMWEKGETIELSEFRGVDSELCPSYHQLEEKTGRTDKSLKQWHTIYLKCPNKTEYKPIAEEKAKTATDKYLASLQKLLTGPSNEPAEIQPGQCRTIIIDPPWPYGTQYDKETRRVASPYPEMTIEAITQTDFPFADDCVLWFWTTHKFLPVSFDILLEWDFDYKAILTWDKEKMGIGHWLRMQCEFCVLAIKGNPVWEATDVRDIITEARREHSRKPEEFYEIVQRICPKPIGEAFPRQKRKGIKPITINVIKEKLNEQP